MVNVGPPTIGGGGDDSVSFSDFVDEDAALWKRVDYLGIVATIGKSWIVALFTFLTGIWLAVSRAVEDIGDAFTGSVESISGALTDGIETMQASAVSEAASSVVDFGILSLPAGVVVVLAAMFVAVVLVYFYIWGDT